MVQKEDKHAELLERFIQWADKSGKYNGCWFKEVPVGLRAWYSNSGVRPKSIDAVCVLGEEEAWEVEGTLRPVHHIAAWLMAEGRLPHHLSSPQEFLAHMKELKYLDAFMPDTEKMANQNMQRGKVALDHVLSTASNLSFTGKAVTLVEVKPGGITMEALGQALVYQHHFEADWLGARVVQSVIVCKRSDHIITPVAKKHGLQVFVAPHSKTYLDSSQNTQKSRQGPDIRVRGVFVVNGVTLPGPAGIAKIRKKVREEEGVTVEWASGGARLGPLHVSTDEDVRRLLKEIQEKAGC